MMSHIQEYFACSEKYFLWINCQSKPKRQNMLNATCAKKHVITFFCLREVNDAKEITASYA